MSLLSDADLLELLKATGRQITIGSATVWAVFDEEYVEALGIAGNRPTVTCRSSDVTGVVDGTAVVVGAGRFLVRGIQPARTGLTKLILELQ